MNVFQQKIEAWLSRPVPERGLVQHFDLPGIVLSTDIGLQRTENQDRVAVLSISSNTTSRPLVAIAVADGMGGMRDGAKCATLALSSFFYALTLHRNEEVERRANAAISFANDSVFKFAGGKGGATLSAVLVDIQLRPHIVHLGDSRVYSFGDGANVERLTTDDSFAEAVGGHGRELLQFAGMGQGMQAHVRPIDKRLKNLAITTDGIHFVEPLAMQSVLAYSTGIKAAAERLAALARWCGGPDNASGAFVDLQSILQHILPRGETGIQLWDPFGSLAVMWTKDESRKDIAPSSALFRPNTQEIVPSKGNPDNAPLASETKKQIRPRAKKNKKGPPKDDIQLEIKIERSDAGGDADDNSR